MYVLAALPLLSSGCGTVSNVVGAIMGKPPEAKVPEPPPPPPKVAVVPARSLEIDVQGDASMNVDARGASAPVLLRIYLLKGSVVFQGADFFALFDRDQATLAGDLVLREELSLRPGQSVSLSRELPAQARQVGVFAAFRDLEHARWRALEPLPGPPEATTSPPPKPLPVPLRIRVGARSIALDSSPRNAASAAA